MGSDTQAPALSGAVTPARRKTATTSPGTARSFSMSEVEEKPQTSDLSEKSDDKLQIAEEEKTEKTEDSEVKAEVKEEEKEEVTQEVKNEESPAKETEEASGSVEKTEETEEQKDEEKPA